MEIVQFILATCCTPDEKQRILEDVKSYTDEQYTLKGKETTPERFYFSNRLKLGL